DVLHRSPAQAVAEEAQLLDGGGAHEGGVRVEGGRHGSSRDRRRCVIIPVNRWRRPSAVYEYGSSARTADASSRSPRSPSSQREKSFSSAPSRSRDSNR